MPRLIKIAYDTTSTPGLYDYDGIEKLTVFWSDQCLEEAFEDDEDEGDARVINALLNNFIPDGRPETRELIERYLERRGKKDAVALIAQGSVREGKWLVDHDGGTVNAKDWVKRQDGKYGLIMVRAGDPGSIEVKTRKTPLLYGSRDFFVPDFGLVNGYTVREAREHLDRLSSEGVVAQ